MKRALFFDLDGTLWNALAPLTDSYNLTLKKEGIPYHYDINKVKSFMGLTPEETCPLAFPDYSLEEGLLLFKKLYRDELVYLKAHPGTLYPEVKETLALLKQDYHLYIVSNADQGYVESFLASLHLEDYFEAFLQAGDTGKAKWENILILKEREHVDDLIYIGDTNKDKVEATHAGVKFIHAAYGFGVINDDLYKIEAFNELPALVKILFKENN